MPGTGAAEPDAPAAQASGAADKAGFRLAVFAAVLVVAVGLLEDHLAHCVVDAARAGDPSAKVKEASDAIARLVRS